MLAMIYNLLSNSGVGNHLDPSSARYVVLTNRFGIISVLIALAILILDFFAHEVRGLTFTSLITFISCLLFCSTILFNRFGKYKLAKWIISWMPPIVIVFISISDKTFYPENITINDFFIYRFLILTTMIIPLLVFSTNNLALLIVNLFPGFISLIFFEAIHKPFGASFSQFGYNDPYFYIMEIVVALAYFGMVGFLLNQRLITDSFEQKLNRHQKRLEENNNELEHKNSFINEQNYEISAQADKLKETNDALIGAKEIIENQKLQLEGQNNNLEIQILEKAKNLSRVNEELIINNNEMRQFSHTLSHNLKSPVATFQGLLNLVEENDLNPANKELLKYLKESVMIMQDVFTDMNEMLELRNQLYTSTESICLQKQIDSLHSHFYPELRRNNIDFSCKCNDIKSIKSNEKRLNDILFQLISNAIKFRSSKRKPEVTVTLNGNDEYHSLKIRDNGIGIDLDKYENKLFYPYQKFHEGIAGKGLGLYLAKLQTESLGGKVKIKSIVDEFTEVEVLLKK